MPFMHKTISARVLAAGLVFSALPCAALAQETSEAAPRASTHSHATAKPATHSGNKVLDGIGRGTDAAGRGIAQGSDATRRGVDHTAERASAPVRRWGEALGRKISPYGASHAAAPSTGPQASAP
jgi:hypothetical protein